jgi:hypothetical protein
MKFECARKGGRKHGKRSKQERPELIRIITVGLIELA